MKNNDILRRIRYIFDYSDKKMIALFDLTGCQISQQQLRSLLEKEEEPSAVICSDSQLATFLNGLIIEKRGKRGGGEPKPEQRLNNNIVFRKLKIAMELRDEDILEIMFLADLHMSKHELSAFFRRPGHKNYRICKDQILRNFLTGLQLKYRPKARVKSDFQWKLR